MFIERAYSEDMRLKGITPAQCRAARSLLHWTQADLALAAGVSLITVRNFENDRTHPPASTIDLMQCALEGAGVRFGPRESVGLEKPSR